MSSVCVRGEGNKDEKTTHPSTLTAAIRAISSPPSTFSGISLFIFLACIISLMYAKQRPEAWVWRTRGVVRGVKNFF